jgi:hypothetical protein
MVIDLFRCAVSRIVEGEGLYGDCTKSYQIHASKGLHILHIRTARPLNKQGILQGHGSKWPGLVYFQDGRRETLVRMLKEYRLCA